MARTANPAEVRVLQSLRQTNIITKAQMDSCIALLEATEQCTRCGGTGHEVNDPPEGFPPGTYMPCSRCEGTGQQRVIR
jgi:DnaJ-class molecular chaperone